ncbi:IS701 family transposase [Streptomyces bingchenggensis]|uniref:IS701 family transposase n=1 Tax=Streptomyces bingchenggensis TaxID=379067 RepID=UPI000A30F62C
MLTGLIAQTRRRTVCGMLLGTGLERVWHHARCHRLFSTARWSADEVGLALAGLVVARLLPDGAPLQVAVDDTLFKRSGKKVFGAAWQHDGAARGPRPAGFGNCWVIVGIVVTVPFLTRPVCLPVLARLWRPRHTAKIALAREMTELLATHFPDRTLHTVSDAAYAGEHLRGLHPQITWTSRLKVTSVLHELPPPRTGKKGRPRTRGPRLGTPTDLSQLLDRHRTKVRRYGRVDTVFLAERTCLWYGSFHTQPVRVVLVWDSNCGPGTSRDRGYGAAPGHHRPHHTSPTDRGTLRVPLGESRPPSSTPARPSASARPATAPTAQSNAPSPSVSSPAPWSPPGTRWPATNPPTPTNTAPEPAGTPPKPSPPSRT